MIQLSREQLVDLLADSFIDGYEMALAILQRAFSDSEKKELSNRLKIKYKEVLEKKEVKK